MKVNLLLRKGFEGKMGKKRNGMYARCGCWGSGGKETAAQMGVAVVAVCCQIVDSHAGTDRCGYSGRKHAKGVRDVVSWRVAPALERPCGGSWDSADLADERFKRSFPPVIVQ